MAQVNDPCPTFSWSEAEGVAQYEIVAYTLPGDPARTVELTAENEVLYAAVPASATSWTPSAAIRGQHPAQSGENYDVVGISSYDGAVTSAGTNVITDQSLLAVFYPE
jgi:hypothetical protein